MTGAEAVMRAAAQLGSTVCFANPGTTELDFVAAFDTVPEVRPVLGLHEDVCTGAADGWARMTGQVGLTLLHLGAGLGNGLANLHNARRAGTPIVNIVGDHPSWHLPFDPPLASDIVGLARSGTLRTYVSSDYEHLDDGFMAAWSGTIEARGPVTLIAGADDAARDVRHAPGWRPSQCYLYTHDATCGPMLSAIEFLEHLGRAHRPAVLLGGTALTEAGLGLARRLQRHTGVVVFTESYPALLTAGRGMPNFWRLPSDVPAARKALDGHDVLFLIGTSDPVAFFGAVPGQSRVCTPDTRAELVVTAPDALGYLEVVADLLPAFTTVAEFSGLPGDHMTERELTPDTVAWAIVDEQPEGAVVIDESNTVGATYRLASSMAPPHIQIGSTAGVLGFGMPAAIGAALADTSRPVLSLQADGSAAYSMQALWTQAKEGLNITTVLLNNCGYETVRSSWSRRMASATRSSVRLSDIREPQLDWLGIAAGFGVASVRVKDTRALRRELSQSFSTSGPSVIVVDL